mmetsp:Transcript_81813/g.249988  ORF Transcript_81813/g.249988 Transcript_81813/m.249988 type:complete len:212 (+) Transcript_81813:1022-1657(+)
MDHNKHPSEQATVPNSTRNLENAHDTRSTRTARLMRTTRNKRINVKFPACWLSSMYGRKYKSMLHKTTTAKSKISNLCKAPVALSTKKPACMITRRSANSAMNTALNTCSATATPFDALSYHCPCVVRPNAAPCSRPAISTSTYNKTALRTTSAFMRISNFPRTAQCLPRSILILIKKSIRIGAGADTPAAGVCRRCKGRRAAGDATVASS